MKVAEIESLRKVGGFLAFAAQENLVFNTTTAEEAFQEFCKLAGVDPEALRKAFIK